ncbi:MAG: hypothetical protein WC775_01245 [Patescibacteria group bacterium]|jgi:hypothetical protein
MTTEQTTPNVEQTLLSAAQSVQDSRIALGLLDQITTDRASDQHLKREHKLAWRQIQAAMQTGNRTDKLLAVADYTAPALPVLGLIALNEQLLLPTAAITALSIVAYGVGYMANHYLGFGKVREKLMRQARQNRTEDITAVLASMGSLKRG